MSMKMNKKNYAEIMEDNITFLNKYAPKCMTTSHIEDILRRSVELEYPEQSEQRPSEWIECKMNDHIENGDYMFILYQPVTKIQSEGYMRVSDNKVPYSYATHYFKIELPPPPKSLFPKVG